MKLTVLSFSCCNPSLKAIDQKYISTIKEVLGTINAEAQVEVVTATEALYGRDVGNTSGLRALFEKYGMDSMPALFINGELVLYGGIPSVQKLTEVIQKAVNPTTPKRA